MRKKHMASSSNLLMLLATLITTSTLLQPSTAIDVSYDGRAIKINGERKIFISGSIHYPRSTPGMWPDLIRTAKEGGLNTIETYVFWNAHEPQYRQYDFTGSNDLVKFIQTVQDAGLYAILRIGPYVCAEWNFGGFPVWLKNYNNITFRTLDENFKREMAIFTTLIVDKVKEAKLFASQGGPIILAQIENEYGNVIGGFGNQGTPYINWCANFAVSLDVGIPWIMCQEGDAPPPMLNTCNGWYCDQFTPNRNTTPKIWTENWSGWFKNWGSQDPHRTPEDLAFAVARFYQYGGTLQNYYMYHGGTNFGRNSGGPYITTSYDYDAPIAEYGNINQPKWGHLKNLHSLLMSMEKVLTYGDVTSKDYGNMLSSTVFSYNGTRACFFGNANSKDDMTLQFEGKSYTVPAWSVSILPDCKTEVYNTAKVNTQTTVMVKSLPADAKEKLHYNLEWKWRLEHFSHHHEDVTYRDGLIDQKLATNDSSDYLWYMTSVNIDEKDPLWGEELTVKVHCYCHVLHAFFNGKLIGSQWVNGGAYEFVFERTAKPRKGKNTLSLLSVTVGLPNYGAHFEEVKNGILGPVTLIAPNSLQKDLTNARWGYQVGLNGFERGLWDPNSFKTLKWHMNYPVDKKFVWYKTTFETPMGDDPVVLDLFGMGKGVAWVNGNNLGRYWPSFLAGDSGCVTSCDYRGSYTGSKCLTNCGNSSQRWYHVPRSYLNQKTNSLILFEEFGGNPKLTSIQTVVAARAHAQAHEGTTLELSCHGKPISKVNFASFGQPNVDHGSLSEGTCHYPKSLSVVEQACVGKESCFVDATEKTFGPRGCESPMNRLAVEVEC